MKALHQCSLIEAFAAADSIVYPWALCRPNPADLMKNKEVTMMMITSGGDESDLRDGKDLRRLALALQVG